MTPKIDLLTAAPDIMKIWTGAALAIAASLEPSLTELVKIRASQINGCANCINMHTAEARGQGETEQRIYLLSAWREAPCYTERERAALGWTEALTRLSEAHAHDKAYGALKAQFSDEDQVKLTLMINIINGWNRLSVGFGTWMEPAAAKRERRPDGGAKPSGRSGRSLIRCARASCVSPIACSARWRTPRTSCRRPSSAGWGLIAKRSVSPRRSFAGW